MEFSIYDLTYFVITIPIVLFTYFILFKLHEKQKPILIIITLSILLFIIRFILTFFSYTIGVMPYLKEEVIFYCLLTIFGVIATYFYVKNIEKKSFADLGWEFKDMKRTILFGLLGYIPLLLMMPLIVILANIQISLVISWEKLIIAITFGLILGGFYEETMFRGAIQNQLMLLTDEKQTIIFTALIFTATHIGYLPFTGYGIMYIFIFVMGLILSILRLKCNQIACFILHGGIVFILVIAV